MKRYISLFLCIILILSSTSFIFGVDWSTTDQTNLSNAASRLYYNGYSAAYYLKQIADKVAVLNTISNDISTIKGYLYDDGHSVAYWVSAINTWMSPIYNSITQTPVDLATIIGALGYYDNSTYYPYLNYINDGVSNVNINKTSGWSAAMLRQYAHRQILSIDTSTGSYNVSYPAQNGQLNTANIYWSYGTPIGNLAALLSYNNQVMAKTYQFRWAADLTGYNTQQTALNWGNLGNSYFTPSSSTDGIYKWFAAIQAPVARLSYVLASQERIEAQEASAVVEQAVVDDFIDSSGDASASASDIGSIADLSSGYQQNFGSTASVTGIFDIFDSNNFSWFSSETALQLDTTVQTRGSYYATPLLDQQLEDINNSLGVTNAN